MNNNTDPVFTIGHSTHSIDVFLKLLRDHGITAVADVRSAPYSRFSPQFNREALQHALKSNGIKYVFLGRELGARSEDRSCYQNGRVQFVRLAQTNLFKSGLERVILGAKEHRICLMCAEKEPLECHRCILVARALVENGIEIIHILGDGSLEPHRVSLERLLDLVGLPSYDLFKTKEQLVEEALAKQGERIAYVEDTRTSE